MKLSSSLHVLATYVNAFIINDTISSPLTHYWFSNTTIPPTFQPKFKLFQVSVFPSTQAGERGGGGRGKPNQAGSESPTTAILKVCHPLWDFYFNSSRTFSVINSSVLTKRQSSLRPILFSVSKKSMDFFITGFLVGSKHEALACRTA